MNTIWLHELRGNDGITILLSHILYRAINTRLAEFRITRRHNPYDLERLDAVPYLGQFFVGVHTLVVIGTETDYYSLSRQWCGTPTLVPLPGVEATLGIGHTLGRCKHLGTYGDGVTDD